MAHPHGQAEQHHADDDEEERESGHGDEHAARGVGVEKARREMRYPTMSVNTKAPMPGSRSIPAPKSKRS